jgi:uncharacterized SAM-binding protein YcdF (DUF218 family)
LRGPSGRWFCSWGGLLAGSWEESRGDVLVVLGGGMLEGGVIGENTYLRAFYAARAWREGGFRAIVVSGGNAATGMRDFLACHGVPATAIHVESKSTSTRENALYTQPVLTRLAGRAVLLTSDFHMFRARRAFRRAGSELAVRPVPDVRKRAAGWLGRWPAFLELVQESIKIVYYRARGWT